MAAVRSARFLWSLLWPRVCRHGRLCHTRLQGKKRICAKRFPHPLLFPVQCSVIAALVTSRRPPCFTLYLLPFPPPRRYWLLAAGDSRDLARQPRILS